MKTLSKSQKRPHFMERIHSKNTDTGKNFIKNTKRIIKQKINSYLKDTMQSKKESTGLPLFFVLTITLNMALHIKYITQIRHWSKNTNSKHKRLVCKKKKLLAPKFLQKLYLITFQTHILSAKNIIEKNVQICRVLCFTLYFAVTPEKISPLQAIDVKKLSGMI